jgi:uncharacterized protein YndB with AHSA1/START domain
MKYDIKHDVTVGAEPARVFDAVTVPALLDSWWSLGCSGEPVQGGGYVFDFGGGCVWRARVAELVRDSFVEYRMTEAADDWMGTSLKFVIEPANGMTLLRFSHEGWEAQSDHFRRTSFCWALYLRLLRRFAETGETVEYERRYDA